MTFVLSIGTAVPPTSIAQPVLRDWLASQPGIGALPRRLIRAAFEAAAIDQRHTVISEMSGAHEGEFTDASGRLLSPTTGHRNLVYRREAPPLFAAAARDALNRAGVEASEVTHVVTVSCTGMFAPGPDFRLVRDLSISPTAKRYHLGFMGCAAAFPALRTAAHICDADADAVVLVACAELCSLHIRSSEDREQIVASAVFADGAAAAVMSSRPRGGSPALEVHGFATAVTEDGESDMDWTVGDNGFEMILTAEVPRIVGREIRAAVDDALGHDREQVKAWAVHPGGRSILDRVQEGLDLPDAALGPSRDVLRDYGNMSSATVLFVLQRILDDEALAPDARVVGLAFGPGLTLEMATFVRRRSAP